MTVSEDVLDEKTTDLYTGNLYIPDLPEAPFDAPKRIAIMLLLERHHCIIVPEMYRSLDLSRGSAKFHLGKLEECNYIKRELQFVNATTQTIVFPTQEGLLAFNQAKKKWADLLDID